MDSRMKIAGFFLTTPRILFQKLHIESTLWLFALSWYNTSENSRNDGQKVKLKPEHENGTSENSLNSSQNGSSKVRSSKVNSTKIGIAKIGIAKVGHTKVRTLKGGAN